MLNFIVLGIVPGTQTQVTFSLFIAGFFSLSILSLVVYRTHRYIMRRKMRNFIARFLVIRKISRSLLAIV